MRLPEFLFSCVLAVLDGGEAPKECSQYTLVKEVTAAIRTSAEKHQLPGRVIAAVAFHESQFNPLAVSNDGMDLGLMQVRRGGAIPARLESLSDRALQNVRLNISIGTSYLARMAKSCKGPPLYWLSRYNGRKCRPSPYSMAVLSALERFATKRYGTDLWISSNDSRRTSRSTELQSPPIGDWRPMADQGDIHCGARLSGLWFFRRPHRVLIWRPSISVA
jgi:hypothetical protein